MRRNAVKELNQNFRDDEGLCGGYETWRWMQHGPPKRWYPTTTLHGVPTKKI